LRLVKAADLTTPDLILPRLAAGDARAMRECIDRYGNLVWGIVRRSIKDTTEAEDLVQEIFTEIWKKAAFFDARVASEITYIGLIARRRSIDYLRRQGRQPEDAAAERRPRHAPHRPAAEQGALPADQQNQADQGRRRR
jgi:RNA polymerase sigma-70 factor (ECF subfamily)